MFDLWYGRGDRKKVVPIKGEPQIARESTSCYYNGTHFMEGSIVPTKEPCLMCKCQSKTLICALKVCPEQPIPPPRGCILVHKSGACCPYLQCSKLHLATKNSGDRKKIHFLDYYEKAAEERLNNPNSYLRRSDDDDVEENGACIVNGTVYKSGSAMTTSSLCSYCYCINGRQKCVKPKCALPNPRCAPVFIDSACCPIRYDCTGKIPVKEIEASTEAPNMIRRINNRHYLRTVEQKTYKNAGCLIEGRSYPEGERIGSPDPCQVCFCIRGAAKCTPKKCAPAIKGCTPRVPRGECCAVRYDCKHGEQKNFGRKIEDEEESFDFFSILFGPDPDEPKPEAKNATVTIPVTEPTPVSSTSEKSFFDFIKAGLDFIDSDDLIDTTVAPLTDNTDSPSTDMIPVTDIPTELQTDCHTTTSQGNYNEKNNSKDYKGGTINDANSYNYVNNAGTNNKINNNNYKKTSNDYDTKANYDHNTETNNDYTKTNNDYTRTYNNHFKTYLNHHQTQAATPTQLIQKEIPLNIELTKAEPAFQDLESDSLLKENMTEVSNSLSDLDSSEESSSESSVELASTRLPSLETVTTEAPKKTTVTPIDVVIKVDDYVNRQTVESILSSLNAKLESFAKDEAALTATTMIVTKRPNNKFVGYDLEKAASTIVPPTSTVGSSAEEGSSESGERSTSEGSVEVVSTTEGDVSGGSESEEDSTVDYRSDEMLVEDMLTTEASVESTTLDYSEEEVETTTEEEYEGTSTTVATTTDQDKMEFKTGDGTELPMTENVTQTSTTSTTTTTAKPKPTGKPVDNLLSVLLSELSNIFDTTKNASNQQNARNRTEIRPVTPKPIPIGEFHRPSSIPSILESDINMDYGEPTLPPSLPNLKIIPFLPADAVKKNEPPIPVAAPYDFYKPIPTNFPIITESYEPYGVLSDHDIHPGVPFKPPKYDYSYDSSLNYPALTENYDLDAKNNQYGTKVMRDKYDTINDSDYDYDTDALAKFDLHSKQELFKNELKKFIPTKYEAPQEGTYVPVYDKYGVGYPEKNVYYPNHKETYEPVVYSNNNNNKKAEVQSTEHPLFRLEEKPVGGSGFSPPLRTEGGFVPKDHIKEEFYYEPYVTTAFPNALTSEDHSAKLPYNTTAASFGATPANPFIDVIRTEPAPPLMSLIEDKEKLFSVYHSVAKNNYSSLDDLLDDDRVDSSEYDRQIISITTDANYLSTIYEESLESVENPAPLRAPMNFTFPIMPETAEYLRNTSEPEPSGMFSLENVLSYLFREDDPGHENGIRNSSASPGLIDGVPPFKSIPSLGDVRPPSDEEQHDGTVTLKVEGGANDHLYRPSLMDLPFLNPNFHAGATGAGASEAAEYKNDIDRYGFDPDVEHYQVISDGPPNTIPNSEAYVVNPVDINKLKQHHSEGTAEITMKSKVYSLKDTVGILKLAGCNIYGRMYRVGRIISELSGPCLECKCTEVGVHCTPLDC
ncbi:conserved hypothetical protein [Culex quinquefasciatus]|uniref:VWFC domain-containing protein n=1 Tax=Culex quinquefasciatus TaxID=7176 RepID=B0W245_CULQU|nr:conserved hypothetical protein [Culex quinquefasciatus]|eukprot:XP_001842808.1 conserved hypothetical protein [Culex quinquefasciatus]